MAAQTLAQVQLVLRLTLGLIFFYSAVTKLRALAVFVRGVLDYAVLPRPLAQFYGRLLPFVELVTALLFLSGVLLLVATGVALLMLVSFAVAIAINAARGRAPACHCFGETLASRVGWHTLARDFVLIVPAGWLFMAALHGGTPSPGLTQPSLAPAVGIGAISSLSYALLVDGLEILVSVPGQIVNRR
jgi:uncharacterized membrane protein YphA (DoxX/SURF4 family)